MAVLMPESLHSDPSLPEPFPVFIYSANIHVNLKPATYQKLFYYQGGSEAPDLL